MLLHISRNERYIYNERLNICMGSDIKKYLTNTIHVYSDGTIDVKQEEKPIIVIEREYEE